ncbi:MAG: methyltransferase domain-containing protein [Opitutales bacterium]|nr:methyltransferase domain-containing protein [Opitutales bacterium]
MKKQILDVCCGGRMWWHNKEDARAVYMDNRELECTLCDGRVFRVSPDVIGDFRNIPFPDESFAMVLFDPPHLTHHGEKSWLFKKYGKLSKNWREDLAQGFKECFRVLKTGGTLIFKWSEIDIKLPDILRLTEVQPVILHKKQKTHFVIFLKPDN